MAQPQELALLRWRLVALVAIFVCVVLGMAIATFNSPTIWCTSGEPSPSCLREWLSAVAPWIAIVVAVASLGPILGQWRLMRQQNAVILVDRMYRTTSELMILIKELDQQLESTKFQIAFCNNLISRLEKGEDNVIDHIASLSSTTRHELEGVAAFISKAADALVTFPRDEVQRGREATARAASDRVGWLDASREAPHLRIRAARGLSADLGVVVGVLNSMRIWIDRRIADHIDGIPKLEQQIAE